ncbi:MAG: hypothetical protein IPI43_10590 [Sandaracinaceae bacterium]|nr:hypothetical protein [Sandaracinaceae bacterium]
MTVLVTCAPGLEKLLAAEVGALLGRLPLASCPVSVAPDGVRVTAAPADQLSVIGALNLGLGLSTGVRVELGSFSASQFPQLVRKLKQLSFQPWIPRGVAVDVRVRSLRSRLYHTKAIADRTRRAIADAFGIANVDALEPDSTEPHARVHVDGNENLFSVSVDTSGEPLYRRGYRLATGKAPLRADLARALVVASGWAGDTPLGDPFCGAGTVMIEAALLASGRLPGAGRAFAFEAAPCHDAARFAAVRARLDVPARASLPRLLGSDRDAGVIESARDNAERAGVAKLITFEVAALSDAPIFVDGTLGARTVVTNPPYGLRVGDTRTLQNLYQRVGTLVRGLPPGSHAALLTPPPRVRDLGLTLERAFESNHGGQHVIASVTAG